MKNKFFVLLVLFCAVLLCNAQENPSGSFTFEDSALDKIQNGQMVYNIPGVGTFYLYSNSGNIKYEKIGWIVKNYRMTIPEGSAAVKAVAESPDKIIKLTRVYFYGESQGAGSTFRFEGTNGDWWLAYSCSSEFRGKAWSEKKFDIITAGVKIRKMTIDYEVVDYSTSETISDNNDIQLSNYHYAEEVILDRNFVEGWNTVCLPFACSPSEIVEGAVAQQFVAYDPATGLDFEIVNNIEPNVPYLLYCPTAVETGVRMSAREVYETLPVQVERAGVIFVGNYKFDFSMYGYYGVADDKLLSGGENSSLDATRAYFIIQDLNKVAELNINYGKYDVTGIETLPVKNKITEIKGVYTINGVRIREDNSTEGLAKGLYIVAGKKVMIK